MAKKVTFSMTEQDLRNVETIEKVMHSRSKADAVGSALSVTAALVNKAAKGQAEIILRHKDGTMEKVLITGLP